MKCMKDCSKTFFVFTHKPNGVYEQKFCHTLSKHFSVIFLSPSKYSDSGDSVYLVTLNKDLSTLFSLIKLALSSIIRVGQGIRVVDVIDAGFFPIPIEKNIILMFGTPLHVEMQWLGYPKIVVEYMKFAQDMLIRKAQLVIAINELMRRYCEKIGARKIIVCPNYPTRKFNPTISRKVWLARNGLAKNVRIALFVAGGRMLEVYGLELLLKAWSLVEKELPDAYLVIVGPAPTFWIKHFAKQQNIKHLHIVGSVQYDLFPNWINAADVCLAPRTPGFPTHFYDDKDSTKINEYAAMSKPIVVCGYSPSTRYLLVQQNPTEFAKGILKAFAGQVKPATPHYWEENEASICEAINESFSTKQNYAKIASLFSVSFNG